MANKPKTQSCGNCRYYQARARYYNPDGTVSYQYSEEVCKRYPQLRDPNTHREMTGEMFPGTHDQQWCGEWSPANPETIDEGSVVLARLVLLGDLTAARALADKLRE